MGERNGGRPTEFNEDIVKEILKLVKSGSPAKRVAAKVGISHQTLRNWLNEGEQAADGEKREFYLAYQKALYDSQDLWLNRIKRGHVQKRKNKDKDDNVVSSTEIATQNPANAWQWLEAHFPDDYGDKTGPQTFFEQEEAYLKNVERVYGKQFSDAMRELADDGKALLGQIRDKLEQ